MGLSASWITMLPIHAPRRDEKTDVTQDLEHVTVRVSAVEDWPASFGVAY